jgi:hypothetical protein
MPLPYNPHIYIFVDAGEPGKEPKAWTIEGASPGILNRLYEDPETGKARLRLGE